MLTISDIAELCGVKKATADHWRHRGVLPPPDLFVGRSPRWFGATIRIWRDWRWDEDGSLRNRGRWPLSEGRMPGEKEQRDE